MALYMFNHHGMLPSQVAELPFNEKVLMLAFIDHIKKQEDKIKY